MSEQQINKHLKPKYLFRTIVGVSVLSAMSISNSYAIEIETENEDLTIRWDNTLKYSTAFRLSDRDSKITLDANLDDGDRNFDKGLVSNRIDLLSEFDIQYKNYGVRFSGAGWYDSVYNNDNDNTSSLTSNNFSVPSNQFTEGTRKLHGQNFELLDAFAFIDFNLGDTASILRVGKHSLLYGESLFFGSNGIAAGQAPVDIVKLLSVPNTQFKEIIRPVGQISIQTQLNETVTIGGYYQYEWEKTRLPGAGSYLSAADYLSEGAERLYTGPGSIWYDAGDMEASDQGQGGVHIRIRPGDGEWDFGLYLTHYHEKAPTFYFYPGVNVDASIGKTGEFREVFAENITSLGGSFSTVFGGVNVAGEASARFNNLLVSDPQIATGTNADNDDNELFARGTSVHAQISAIGFMGKTALFDGGSWVAEVAWHRRVSIDKNPAAIDPETDRSALAFRGILTMEYFQVLPNLDLSIPIGIGYNPLGRSSVITNFNGGAYHGGDFSIGANFRYDRVWSISAQYVNYFGQGGGFLTPANSAPQFLSNEQTLDDRDFIALSVQRTF